METNILQNYLNDIAIYPLLSAEEEIHLSTLMLESEDEFERNWARDRFINCNLKLVVSIARQFKGTNGANVDLMDLINVGNTGLIIAVEKYNPQLQYRFSTYGTLWVRQAITKFLTNQNRALRLPVHIYQLLRSYKAVVTHMAIEQEELNEETIAGRMGISVGKLRQLQEWDQSVLSLSAPSGSTEEESTLEDVQVDSQLSPDLMASNALVLERLYDAIKTLPDTTRYVIELRYGVGDPDIDANLCFEHTLEEVGALVGMTRERVRQLEKRGLNLLREAMRDADTLVGSDE